MAVYRPNERKAAHTVASRRSVEEVAAVGVQLGAFQVPFGSTKAGHHVEVADTALDPLRVEFGRQLRVECLQIEHSLFELGQTELSRRRLLHLLEDGDESLPEIGPTLFLGFHFSHMFFVPFEHGPLQLGDSFVSQFILTINIQDKLGKKYRCEGWPTQKSPGTFYVGQCRPQIGNEHSRNYPATHTSCGLVPSCANSTACRGMDSSRGIVASTNRWSCAAMSKMVSEDG